MYYFYLDKLLLPVAPEKLELKIKNQNKTMNLINEGEINQIKTPRTNRGVFWYRTTKLQKTIHNIQKRISTSKVLFRGNRKTKNRKKAISIHSITKNTRQ